MPSAAGVHLVPAFSGLGAPYFDGDARAALVGLGRGTTRAHIVRAALDAMALQDVDVLEAMRRECGEAPALLRVDGGPTRNALLMQTRSDLSGLPVQTSAQSELSALGAACLAGAHTGFYPSVRDIPALRRPGACYAPRLPETARRDRLDAWHDAVRRVRSRFPI